MCHITGIVKRGAVPIQSPSDRAASKGLPTPGGLGPALFGRLMQERAMAINFTISDTPEARRCLPRGAHLVWGVREHLRKNTLSASIQSVDHANPSPRLQTGAARSIFSSQGLLPSAAETVVEVA
jgi:hypothetical protein